MQIIDRFMMLQVAVKDMPKAKEFYADTLGLQIASDYRRDDANWWVSLSFPEGGVTMTLTTYHGNMEPGKSALYFGTSDIDAAHTELSNNGVAVGEVKNDLHGPGSGVRFFQCNDQDGNQITFEQI